MTILQVPARTKEIQMTIVRSILDSQVYANFVGEIGGEIKKGILNLLSVVPNAILTVCYYEI